MDPSYYDKTILNVPPDLFWGSLGLVAIIAIAMAIIFFVSRKPFVFVISRKHFARAQELLGLNAISRPVFFFFLAFWAILFCLLAFGLLKLIWDIIWSALPIADPGVLADNPDKRAELWDWRFGLAKLTALTGVLAAVVALPFTLIRLGLMRSQTEQAADSLFNEKIEAALTSLYATRQITKKVANADGVEDMRDVHEDDIVRRNAAIDALEGLAGERPAEVIRISRILSVYVRELSKELSKEPSFEEAPKDGTPNELSEWALSVKETRSDMVSSVQTLGRLRHTFTASFAKETIDISGAVLRRVYLSKKDLNFEKVNLRAAQLQGADLRGAQLQGADLREARLQGAVLSEARLQGANLSLVRLQGANLSLARLQGADLSWAWLQGADLGWAQLQGADLSLASLQGADLSSAQLQGANLSWAQLQGANLSEARFDASTSLSAATLRGAALSGVDLTMIPYFSVDLSEVFGDRTVKFPKGVDVPEQFERSYKGWEEFKAAWRAFQKEIGFDPNDPSTWEKRKD